MARLHPQIPTIQSKPNKHKRRPVKLPLNRRPTSTSTKLKCVYLLQQQPPASACLTVWLPAAVATYFWRQAVGEFAAFIFRVEAAELEAWKSELRRKRAENQKITNLHLLIQPMPSPNTIKHSFSASLHSFLGFLFYYFFSSPPNLKTLKTWSRWNNIKNNIKVPWRPFSECWEHFMQIAENDHCLL